MRPSEISGKSVLISALDWGMGHTTRCVSIIRQFINQNNELTFAGNDVQIGFMRREFPELHFALIEGYDVSLNPEKNTYLQMLTQSLSIDGAIKREKKWVEDFLRNHKIDLIISDNRYGFRSDSVPSIIITHQLSLQIPTFSKTASKQLQKYINQFSACWIPDREVDPICGELVKAELDIPIYFIGLLNRFRKLDLPKVYDKLVILSGPEPARTQFEKTAIEWLEAQLGKCAIVGARSSSNSGIDFFDDPPTEELNKLIAQSELIVSRAGYTTIMEMIGLDQKALLIPTKGQFEQEYLANTLVSSSLSFSTIEKLLTFN